LIFEEDINDFRSTLIRVTEEFTRLVPEIKDRTYDLDTLRLKYPQAYMPWTSDDDSKLEALFCEGKTVKELATIFERRKGAISARIKKLELMEKYT